MQKTALEFSLDKFVEHKQITCLNPHLINYCNEVLSHNFGLSK